MVGLLLIGLVAGVVAGISPCILPVLPVVLVAGSTAADSGNRERRLRSVAVVAVVAGLVVSFSVVTLVGSTVLSALGLPQDLLRDLGLVVLGVIGAGLLVPALGHLLERPFARLTARQPTGRYGGFVLGLGLGGVFVPCAGPVLAAITLLGTTHHLSVTGVLLTLTFSVGAAIPLLAVAFAGDALVARARGLRAHAPALRRIGGVVLLAMMAAIALNLTNGLQTAVPGYTSALQKDVEGTNYAKSHLASLTGNGGGLGACSDSATALEECGAAPAFTGIAAWLNTPHDQPLTLAGLRGKVVLVDFWTYSCINCQRTLPHVEAWAKRYGADGFVVVGVSTPEFAFEHVVSNVAGASQQLGVDYPVAIDDSYKTWDAYHNQYWPAEYLIDAQGEVRHVHFAEGEYGQTESFIRQLLVAADPTVSLPPRTDVPDRTPDQPVNPETYLGYDRLQYLVGATAVPDAASVYGFPASVPPGGYALSGTWTIGSEEATAGSDAKLELGFQADDIYLVLSGTGTVGVEVNGKLTKTVTVSGIPGLYTLLSSSSLQTGVMTLTMSPGVEAYDFTFG